MGGCLGDGWGMVGGCLGDGWGMVGGCLGDVWAMFGGWFSKVFHRFLVCFGSFLGAPLEASGGHVGSSKIPDLPPHPPDFTKVKSLNKKTASRCG